MFLSYWGDTLWLGHQLGRCWLFGLWWSGSDAGHGIWTSNPWHHEESAEKSTDLDVQRYMAWRSPTTGVSWWNSRIDSRIRSFFLHIILLFGKLRHDFLNTPIHVQVGNASSLSANEDISQEVWMLNSTGTTFIRCWKWTRFSMFRLNLQRETMACFYVLCRIVNSACCWFLSDDKDAALVEALQLYGGTGQRVLVFVAMKKQCDVGAPDIYPLSNGKRVKMCKDVFSLNLR